MKVLRVYIRTDGACWGCCFTPSRPATCAVLWEEGDGMGGIAVCRFCLGTIEAERAAQRKRIAG